MEKIEVPTSGFTAYPQQIIITHSFAFMIVFIVLVLVLFYLLLEKYGYIGGESEGGVEAFRGEFSHLDVSPVTGGSTSTRAQSLGRLAERIDSFGTKRRSGIGDKLKSNFAGL